jgi:hypothetical protein
LALPFRFELCLALLLKPVLLELLRVNGLVRPLLVRATIAAIASSSASATATPAATLLTLRARLLRLTSMRLLRLALMGLLRLT